MNPCALKKILLFISILLISVQSEGWGFHAHRIINRKAIYMLPPEMFFFYKQNLNYLEAHAVDPDKRRYAVDGEAPKHYIDLDQYLQDSIDMDGVKAALPIYWEAGMDSLLKDSLAGHGILPWNLTYRVYRLSRAMARLDAEAILRLSAEIGHYAGDAHVPLHTTANYNGQLTGQYGIHALWESSIPEAFSEEYFIFSKVAKYHSDPQLAIWEVILDSHSMLDSVLGSDRKLREEVRAEWIYASESTSWTSKVVYSDYYINRWNKDMGELVQDRMRASAHFVASLWYTAWINAGQPDLSSLGKSGCQSDLSETGSEIEPEHH